MENNMSLLGQRTFPEFNSKAFGKFVLAFLLPNILFFIIAYYIHATRLIINIDYIFPCALLLFGNKFIRLLGVILLVFLMLLESQFLLLKFFPFLDIHKLIDLLPFIFIGPREYLILFLLFLFIILFVVLLTYKLTNIEQKFYSIVFLVFMALAYWYAGLVYEFEYQGKNNYFYDQNRWSTKIFYINSQYKLYSSKTCVVCDFTEHLHKKAELIPYKISNKVGSDSLISPYNDKILFVVAESFGILKNEEVQRDIFDELYKQSEHFEFINTGEIDIYSMATVEAEFRELCHKSVENGFAIKKIDDEHFKSCMPHMFNEKGYKTVSFHGALSVMYDRYYSYPRIGFQKSLFQENMSAAKRCHSFPGVCDSEIFPLVASEFKNNNKVFVYWLTLTSHNPYLETDIVNHRFDCNKYHFDVNGGLCHNLKLQTQFVDQLAEFSKREEMKGVEIILVGDHVPPRIAMNELGEISDNKVAFLHLKIKE